MADPSVFDIHRWIGHKEHRQVSYQRCGRPRSKVWSFQAIQIRMTQFSQSTRLGYSCYTRSSWPSWASVKAHLPHSTIFCQMRWWFPDECVIDTSVSEYACRQAVCYGGKLFYIPLKIQIQRNLRHSPQISPGEESVCVVSSRAEHSLVNHNRHPSRSKPRCHKLPVNFKRNQTNLSCFIKVEERSAASVESLSKRWQFIKVLHTIDDMLGPSPWLRLVWLTLTQGAFTTHKPLL